METKTHLLKIEEMGGYKGARTRYAFHEANKKGEQIIVELMHIDLNTKLGRTWKSKKWIDKDLNDYIAVDVYVTDKKGFCWGKYNPQNTKEHKINFDWIIEDTKQNRIKILTEVAKLANA